MWGIVCAAAIALAACFSLSCLPDPDPGILPTVDIKPPLVIEAAPGGARSFDLVFDEEILLIEGSYYLEPGPVALEAVVSGPRLSLVLPFDQAAGAEYAVAGEVEDSRGNVTRFTFGFAGFNDRKPRLRIAEVQTQKNDSKTKPRRDFVELFVLGEGNLGGVELEWASAVKRSSYRFPGAEVRSGDLVILHLQPEGGETDELGASTSVSSGIDATPGGRDLWMAGSPLPDECGILVLRPAAGERACDALFYATSDRCGVIGEGRLSELAGSLLAEGLWIWSGQEPSWEDAFRWKSSSARSICRRASELASATSTCPPSVGPSSWYLTDTGAQSPGERNSAPSEGGSKAANKPASKKSGKK